MGLIGPQQDPGAGKRVREVEAMETEAGTENRRKQESRETEMWTLDDKRNRSRTGQRGRTESKQ